MKVLTIRSQIRDVADRWRDQYIEYVGRKPRWKECGGQMDSEAIYGRLAGLDVETATPDDVKAIIGNGSWIRPVICDECGRTFPALAQFTIDMGYEEAIFELCAECLRQSADVLDDWIDL